MAWICYVLLVHLVKISFELKLITNIKTFVKAINIPPRVNCYFWLNVTFNHVPFPHHTTQYVYHSCKKVTILLQCCHFIVTIVHRIVNFPNIFVIYVNHMWSQYVANINIRLTYMVIIIHHTKVSCINNFITDIE